MPKVVFSFHADFRRSSVVQFELHEFCVKKLEKVGKNVAFFVDGKDPSVVARTIHSFYCEKPWIYTSLLKSYVMYQI